MAERQGPAAGGGPARGVRGPSLWSALLGDGRPLLAVVAVSLMFAGALAVFLSVRGEFLPHDEAFLGMTAGELCGLADCRVVDFMLHDRAAFGGVLLALGLLYLWLIALPLRAGEPWAWWLLVVTGVLGFATFLTYLGYGYLDSWHGWGTLALLPFAIVGTARARRHAGVAGGGPGSLRPPGWPTDLTPRERTGWRLVLVVTTGFVLVGTVIVTIGIDAIFVREDIAFIGLSREQLDAATPRLVPLIAHDRAGFGGGILVGGLLATGGVLHAAGTRGFWQATVGAGVLAFTTAIGVHVMVGYTDPLHLAPAYTGATLLAIGLWLTRPPAERGVRT